MILLDTNVVSELIRPAPSNDVVVWIDAQRTTTLWIPSVALAELFAGIALLPTGKRKRELGHKLRRLAEHLFGDRVADFDADCAAAYGEVVAKRQRLGRPISVIDAQIASIGVARTARVATRNVDDFAGTGVDVVNPWKS